MVAELDCLSGRQQRLYFGLCRTIVPHQGWRRHLGNQEDSGFGLADLHRLRRGPPRLDHHRRRLPDEPGRRRDLETPAHGDPALSQQGHTNTGSVGIENVMNEPTWALTTSYALVTS